MSPTRPTAHVRSRAARPRPRGKHWSRAANQLAIFPVLPRLDGLSERLDAPGAAYRRPPTCLMRSPPAWDQPRLAVGSRRGVAGLSQAPSGLPADSERVGPSEIRVPFVQVEQGAVAGF